MSSRVLLPLILVTLIIVGCTPSPELRNDAFLDDTSLITGEPCEAPCWQNLIPGETAWGVVLDTFDLNEDFIQVDSENSRRTPVDWIDYTFRDGPKCCRIYSADGEVLDSILLLLSPQMTLGEVIERYGEPSYMTAQAETSEQASVQLVYPDIPMVLYVFSENITDSELTAENEIIGVAYLSATAMDSLLQTENLYNWNGYGVLADVINGEFDLTPLPETDTNTQ